MVFVEAQWHSGSADSALHYVLKSWRLTTTEWRMRSRKDGACSLSCVLCHCMQWSNMSLTQLVWFMGCGVAHCSVDLTHSRTFITRLCSHCSGTNGICTISVFFEPIRAFPNEIGFNIWYIADVFKASLDLHPCMGHYDSRPLRCRTFSFTLSSSE